MEVEPVPAVAQVVDPAAVMELRVVIVMGFPSWYPGFPDVPPAGNVMVLVTVTGEIEPKATVEKVGVIVAAVRL